jgi:hypothetical protein
MPAMETPRRRRLKRSVERAETPSVEPSPPAVDDRTPLWLTLRGASHGLVLVWSGWMLGAAGLAAAIARTAGPAGAVLTVLAAGWVLARWLAVPPECERRYHLDDEELTVVGPGPRVRRIAWQDITSITQERTRLRVCGPGVSADLPLQPLLDGEAWFEVLRRVVPVIAAEMWTALEDQVVRLAPNLAPPTRSLAWWAYAPALLACMATGRDGLILALVIAACERTVALMRSRGRAIALHPAGLSLRGGGPRRGGMFVPWNRAEAEPTPGGLRVMLVDRGAGVVSSAVPNFWAAAAVIQLRARLGADAPHEVHFRVRVMDGGLAVVGEVEARH